jgi:hypothetical protein
MLELLTVRTSGAMKAARTNRSPPSRCSVEDGERSMNPAVEDRPMIWLTRQKSTESPITSGRGRINLASEDPRVSLGPELCEIASWVAAKRKASVVAAVRLRKRPGEHLNAERPLSGDGWFNPVFTRVNSPDAAFNV